MCRAKLDGNEELAKFTQDLEAATLATIEAGKQRVYAFFSPMLGESFVNFRLSPHGLSGGAL